MYGTNPIAKARTGNFLVHSIWYTIQGEGPFAGLPAIFLRLAGCNLRCHFCDTEFDVLVVREDSGERSASALADALNQLRQRHGCDLIVITGGEPMLQPLPLLMAEFRDDERIRFQIETAGSVWPKGLENWFRTRDECLTIVTSPKTPAVHPRIEQFTDAWKYIIRVGEISEDDGLPFAMTQIGAKDPAWPNKLFHKLYRPADLEVIGFDRQTIFVQACDEGVEPTPSRTQINQRLAADIAMKHGYRLSVQLHKIVGLD